MVRDCPRLRRGASLLTTQAPRISKRLQTSRAVVTTPVTALPTYPVRGGGQTGRGCPRGGGQARCYANLGRMEAVASDAVIIGIILFCRKDASVLFDLGSTYSYVSSYIALYLGISHDSLSSPIYVSMSVGDFAVVDHVYRSCLVVIGGFKMRANQLLFSIVNFDLILGMDWLSPYHAILDCHAKTMTLAM
ncbi:uncharacterized protein [Nicotiana tomentosiformis]|uniref:uncharacterized protein n=1 Tax=Nicotiana tomentosiformis TaxID=4098 RepID=UPI00388CA4B1